MNSENKIIHLHTDPSLKIQLVDKFTISRVCHISEHLKKARIFPLNVVDIQCIIANLKSSFSVPIYKSR